MGAQEQLAEVRELRSQAHELAYHAKIALHAATIAAAEEGMPAQRIAELVGITEEELCGP